jgi:Asp-tRNA(Asn)/Glu-tRNA(Gln) amidotransferase A subunit family amidase
LVRAAQRRRTDLIAVTAKAFEKFDVLITAPTAGTPPLLTEQRPDDGFSRPLLTTVAHVAAVRSMVVCGGFTAVGLPLGLEIMGLRGATRPCCALGTSSSGQWGHGRGSRRCRKALRQTLRTP